MKDYRSSLSFFVQYEPLLPSIMHLSEGIVIRSVGSSYRVLLTKNQQIIECALRGKVRLQNLKTTNPIAVGDKVLVSQENTSGPVIVEILSRSNYILRKATNLSKQSHILCANIDQLLLVVSVDFPHTPFGFIDRILVTAAAYHIPVVIVINKIDLLKNSQQIEKLSLYQSVYESLGYPVYCLCALDSSYQTVVQGLLSNRISFLVGLSGSGKSTLINQAVPSLNLKIGSLSNFSNKGKHTTTFAEMFVLKELNASVIDAPGIQEFNLAGFQKHEIGQYFPEFQNLMHECKYSNCLHLEEPACAVKKALASKQVAPSRYYSYLMMAKAL